jgi:hypothetical protein
MNAKGYYRSLVCLIVLWLVSCSPNQSALQIAVHPKDTPIARYHQYPPLVYNAYIELDVSNVDRAASQAVRLAIDYGGRQANSYSWYVDNRKHTTLDLLVPSANFMRLRAALIDLGELSSDSTVGVPAAGPSTGPYPEYSQITLHLRSTGFIMPPFRIGSWDPMGTLRSAFSVFVSIFGFLADVAIWLVVVVGPFFLVGFGIRWLYRRWRQNP